MSLPALTRAPSPLRAPIFAGLGGAALAAALLARDPHTPGAWGTCIFRRLTGLPCPACGGLRATYDLLTGDLPAALSSNAYAVLTVVVAAIGYVAWLAAAVRGRRPGWAALLPTMAVWWSVGLVVFGLARYLPALSGLRP